MKMILQGKRALVTGASVGLLDGLSLAKSDADARACKARFEKGMALAQEVKELCLATCG